MNWTAVLCCRVLQKWLVYLIGRLYNCLVLFNEIVSLN